MKGDKFLLLHFIVLLWGFTPVLGKLISLDAYDLVWYRLIFSIISLYAYIRYKGISIKVSRKDLLIMSATGVIVGIHWFFFYHAIRVSNVSVCLAGFSTTTLFASLLQPLLLKKPFYWSDVIYGLAIGIGLVVILNFESMHIWGMFYGMMAALTGAFFSIYNGKLVGKTHATVITLYEFAGALLVISLLKCGNGMAHYIPVIGWWDLLWLLLLSVLCTTLAFSLSIEILNYITPLTVIITNNLEPVYGIFFSLLLFGSSEYMSVGFYIGTAIILVSVFTYPIIAQQFKKQHER